jgi:hypothetical protein
VPKQRQDRIGVLVVRAFVTDVPHRRLLVRILEVDPPGPDRVVGTVDTASAAAELLARWIQTLQADDPADDAAR